MIGRLLRPVRAGFGSIAWYHSATDGAPETITLTSDAFGDNAAIPRRYAGKGVGDNISPPLQWSDIPASAVELVLIIEDPDVPLLRPIVHGLVTGIGPHAMGIPEGALGIDSAAATSTAGGATMRIGVGAFERRGYAGPRPIPGHGPHRYVFQMFALDRPSGLGTDATRTSTLSAIDGHVLARGKLTGTYERG
ncbi:YbhB/YbcL family Raf kinase inhibitor-like protein [Nocardia sp. CA-119907]|uniref:YbhB/YbcL family Raf kinase inhibitor-like protein n=1 Tax=Nocardia sp. CA-119907 TaxID=3239973 RepID=UPI003D993A6D